MRNWNEPPPDKIPQPQNAIVVEQPSQPSPEKSEPKSKAQQYQELREKQKNQFLEKQKTKNMDNGNNYGGGMQDFPGNHGGNQDQDEGLDALEKMNLDNRIDDSNMYDQFNPMGGGYNAPGLELQAQSNKIQKKNTFKVGQEDQS